MDAERLVEFGDERSWQPPYPLADPLDGNGTDLLGLRLGVAGQPGLVGGQQDLEWVDTVSA